MGDLIDFTLSNARRFYSSKGKNLAAKGLNGERTVKGDLPSETEKPLYTSLQARQGVRFIIVAIRFPMS